MNNPLGVAVVGIGPQQWSNVAHLPAINATDGVELVRLVTSTPESAQRAQSTWNVPAGHELQQALDDEAVDIVTVTVRVARHAEIASAAIAAGKHLYCEWPLGIDADQARELAALSDAHPGRVHLVGLQGRLSPALREAADVIADGTIGRPVAASVQVFVSQSLHPRPLHRAHLRHRSASANVLSIQGGHTLDMLLALLGDPGPVHSARVWTAIDEFTVLETGEKLPRDAPDNVAALLEVGGIPVTAQFSQTSARSFSTIEILGTEGSLLIEAPDQPQMSPLTVTVRKLDGTPVPLPTEVPAVGGGLDPSHPGFNVALAYRHLVDAVTGARSVAALPTFHRAVTMHDFVDAIDARARTPLG